VFTSVGTDTSFSANVDQILHTTSLHRPRQQQLRLSNSSEPATDNMDMDSNDLIIDDGFAVLNDFKPGSDNDDDESNPKPTTLPRYPFASYADALSISSDDLRTTFLNDCSLVFTARTKEDSDGYSTGSTFFLPCLMKPRCALEALAQTIFRAHVDSLGEYTHADKGGKSELVYDPERSGAEWWTLVLDAPSVGEYQVGKNEDEENNDEDQDDEVAIHFDADYGTCLSFTLALFFHPPPCKICTALCYG